MYPNTRSLLAGIEGWCHQKRPIPGINANFMPGFPVHLVEFSCETDHLMCQTGRHYARIACRTGSRLPVGPGWFILGVTEPPHPTGMLWEVTCTTM